MARKISVCLPRFFHKLVAVELVEELLQLRANFCTFLIFNLGWLQVLGVTLVQTARRLFFFWDFSGGFKPLLSRLLTFNCLSLIDLLTPLAVGSR